MYDVVLCMYVCVTSMRYAQYQYKVQSTMLILEPEGSRLRTGAPAEETAGREVEGGRNQVGLEGTGEGRGGRV